MPEGIDALTDIEGVLLHRLVHVSGGGEWGAELLMRRGAETASRGLFGTFGSASAFSVCLATDSTG